MAQLMDYARYLAKEVGARPAGTEEEQQAALYITERFQKEAGFTANIEEFDSTSNPEAARAILALVTIVATILAIIFQVLAIPAFVLALAAAAVYVAELLDRPILSRVLSHGASQNVLAKYQPNPDAAPATPRTRTRKIILVAHYDTGRVTPPLVERAESLGLPLVHICVGAMALAAFLLLIRIFIAPAGGIGLIILNILSVLAALVCALPVAKSLLMRTSPYNEGANNNATGAAALIEIARRISRGSVSEADLVDGSEGVTIHGAAAAYEAGLIPEGAELRYEAREFVPDPDFVNHGDQERLIAAKAAIAAMTGKPVERKIYGSVADKLINTHLPEDADPAALSAGLAGQAASAPASASGDPAAPGTPGTPGTPGAPAVAPAPYAEPRPDLPSDADGFQNAPSWFIAAQQNAKKNAPDDDPSQIQRSKYTEAMENADRARADREREEADAQQAQREAELKARHEEARAAVEAAQRDVRPEEALQNLRERAALDAQAAAELAEPADVAAGAPAAAQAQAQAQTQVQAQIQSQAQAQISDQTPAPARTRGAGVDAIFGGAGDPAPATSAAPAPEPASAPPGLSGLPAVSQPGDPDATIAHKPVPLTRQAIDLPEIDSPAAPDQAQAQAQPQPAAGTDRASRLQKLRTNVPSLSGLITPVSTEDFKAEARRAAAENVPAVVNVPTPAEPKGATPSASRAHASAPATRQAPVDYDMEVPTSRAGGLLSKLRGGGSGSELEETPQEWLDVDEDFDARSVGRARGSWESFRSDLDDYDEDDGFDEFGTGDEGKWQGGAYSRVQLGHVDMRSGHDAPADEMVPDEPPETEAGRSITGEIERIYHFRNPQFNNEIWFVAMGADNEAHSGARAFLAEHADELRGSMVIEIESLGYGALSVAKDEGRLRRVNASSRIKRYTRTATQATGIALDEVSLAGTDSIASVIQKAGFQSMHLFGADNGRPAMKGSPDDVLENIEELLFDEHVNFVYELLKH